jgi:hypothetical protein
MCPVEARTPLENHKKKSNAPFSKHRYESSNQVGSLRQIVGYHGKISGMWAEEGCVFQTIIIYHWNIRKM